MKTLPKSLLVGAGYAVALAVTRLLLSQGVDAGSLFWAFIGASVMGFALGSLAASMPATWSRHLLVWGGAIFFNIASVTIEGRFFAPELVEGSLISILLQQLLVALATAWLIVELFAPVAETTTAPIQRSWFSWLWRFIVSALSYVFFYYLFGALTYLLVTGPYYESHAGGLVVPAQEIILKAELIRAPLMVLSIIPLLLNFPANRRRMMFLSGLVLFAVGGVMPLLMQVGALPLVVLAASAVEIFCGNLSLGLVTARLMGRPESVTQVDVREHSLGANA
jgi:hypothetical protein